MIIKNKHNEEKEFSDTTPVINELDFMSSTQIFTPILSPWSLRTGEDNQIIGNIEIKTFPTVGHTLYHMIRRCALGLSSAYKVTGFRFTVTNHGKNIEPAHEYESIPGIVEDVPYINHNIKGVVVKVTQLEKKDEKLEYFILNINSEKSGPLYAGDIDVEAFNQTNQQVEVEIVNKDHLILSLDLNTRINGKILFRYGFGYASEENNEKFFKKHLTTSAKEGYFFLNSQFTNGVLSVKGSVEEVTSGSVPYDSLKLEVITDGGINPEEVVINCFKILNSQNPYKMEEGPRKSEEEENDSMGTFEDKRLRDLNFMDDAVVNLLEQDPHRIFTIKELLKHSEKSLKKTIRGLGDVKLQHIREGLKSLGLVLPQDKKED